MRRLKNTRVVIENKLEKTTVGLIYKAHEDDKGLWVVDDYGDKLQVKDNYYEEVK